MLKVAVVEDNTEDLEILKAHIEHYSHEKNMEIKTDVFRNGRQFLFSFQPVYDIVFLDIEMPELDGMSAARKLREKDPEVIIIFTTNMAQYAIEGYKVHARAYLLKPVSYINFYMEMSDSVQSIHHEQEQSFLIQSENGMVRVNASEILYVESQKHNQLFHTKDHVYIMRTTITEVEQKLSNMYFVRSSVSYLVNLKYVKSVEKDTAVVGDDRVPVSRQKKKAFLQALTDYIGGTYHA